MEKPSRDGFTNTNRANLKILRDSSILSLYLSLYVLSLLTCVVLVPLECVRGGASVGCRWGHGSLAPAMRFFSEHSSCTAVPQETMGKPSRKGFTNTNRANLKILRDSSILSLSLFLFLSVCLSLLTCVVLVPLECVRGGASVVCGWGTALLLLHNITFLFRALQLYCCTTENDGKTKQEWVYEHKQNQRTHRVFCGLPWPSQYPGYLCC